MGTCYNVMSTKEKQATPKAAFVFLVPLANEQPAKQAGTPARAREEREHERKTSDAKGICFSCQQRGASAGTRADESTKEKQATPKAAFVFHVPLANEQPAKQAGKRQRGLESGREHERKTSDAERNLIRQIGFINEQRRSF